MLSTSDPSPYRQETALRPRLRSRAARAADLSGLRFTDEEITAALKPTGGRVAAAQRLLTMDGRRFRRLALRHQTSEGVARTVPARTRASNEELDAREVGPRVSALRGTFRGEEVLNEEAG